MAIFINITSFFIFGAEGNLTEDRARTKTKLAVGLVKMHVGAAGRRDVVWIMLFGQGIISRYQLCPFLW